MTLIQQQQISELKKKLLEVKRAIFLNCKDCDPERIGCSFNCPLEKWKPRNYRSKVL